MPIDYRDYPKDWKQTSKRIREEAGQCQLCGVPNGAVGWRVKDGTFYSQESFAGGYIPPQHETELSDKIEAGKKPIKIVLTVAHLDHNVANNDEANLKALCQRCHLNHDRPDNARRRKYGKRFIANAPQLF